MPITVMILVLAALCAAVLFFVVSRAPMETEVPEGIRFELEPEDATELGQEFVTMYMFVDGEYHSLDIIVGDKTNGYRYGAGNAWKGTAGTMRDAIECAKMYMIADVKKGGVV